MVEKFIKSDEEIEKQMFLSLNKINFEMKKIKFYLWIAKKIKWIQKFKN